VAADDIAHLLRRTEFCVRPARLAELGGGSIDDAVNSVTDFTPNANPQLPANLATLNTAIDQHSLAYDWWLDSMATRPRPFQEKMTLFWHGHFVSEWDFVGRADHMLSQNQLYRTNALGNFEALTQAMALEPAMLLYLSNANNVKSAPNQNFARELMELFTLGVGNYTEEDVDTGARAWTGYNYDRETHQYEYRSSRHDDGQKVLFGKTANWNGPGIIHEILVDNVEKRPIAAKFIVKKLWEFLAYPKPAQNIVDELAAVFMATNLELLPTVQALLSRPEFYSAEAKQGLVRTPTEWAVAILAATGLTSKQIGLYNNADRMGQKVFDPPNVSGWRNNAYWLTTSALSGRAAVAKQAAQLWAANNYASIINMSATEAVDSVTQMFGVAPLSAQTYGPLLAAHQAERAASNNAKNTVTNLVVMVLLSGEMNVG
jgi:uncharacterized protein (DUF1800 family)